MQALETYGELAGKFNLEGNISFARQMAAGILSADSWKENTGDMDHWRVMLDEDGRVSKVQDDGDKDVIKIVDKNGKIIKTVKNDGTSLTRHIADELRADRVNLISK